MKTKLAQILFGFQKNYQLYIQIVLVAVTLALFALGAGAPDSGGTGTR